MQQSIFSLSVFGICALFATVLCAATDAELQAYLNKSSSSSSSFKSGESRFGFDLSGTASLIDFNFLNTDSFGPKVDWTGPDVGGDDWQFGLGANIFARFGDHKISFTYQGLLLESYADRSTQPISFGGATIPANSDLDAKASLHHMLLEDIKMRWQLDEAGEWNLGYSWGFGYDIAKMGLDSDAFPISKTSQRMREMLPYPVLGGHVAWQVNDRMSYGLSLRLGYLPELSTFQKRNGEKLKQETLFFEIGVSERYKLNRWLVIGGSARYQVFDHTLKGDGPAPTLTQKRVEQSFELSMFTFSLDIGVRF